MSASTLPPTDTSISRRLADSLGRRRVFMPGVALFMVGSLLCGLAGSVGLLIGARLIQGVGGAVVAASSFAVMLPEFPPARRSTAIGIAGATGALWAWIVVCYVLAGLTVMATFPDGNSQDRA